MTEKYEIYNELLEEHEKLIHYASNLFDRRNHDTSLSIDDFKQDAMTLLWNCCNDIEQCECAKEEIHKLWKCCLFRHINNLIKRQLAKKRKGFHVSFHDNDCEEFNHRSDIKRIMINDFHFITSSNNDLKEFIKDEHANYLSNAFLEFLLKKYKKKNLKYKIFELICRPNDEFEEFAKQNSKKDIYTFRLAHIAKFFDVSRPAITVAIKSLKEDFQQWQTQELDSVLMKELSESF